MCSRYLSFDFLVSPSGYLDAAVVSMQMAGDVVEATPSAGGRGIPRHSLPLVAESRQILVVNGEI